MDEIILSKKIDVKEKITLASTSKRSGAALFDFFIFIILTFILFTFANHIAVNSSKGREYKLQLVNRYIESGLFTYAKDSSGEQDKSNVALNYFDDYKGYVDMFTSYYLTYLKDFVPTHYSSSLPKNFSKDKYTIYWFNCFILGQEDVNHLYDNDSTYSNIPTFIKEEGRELFTYKLDDEGKKILNEIAIPAALNNDENSKLDDETKTRLKEYFYNNKQDNNGYVYYYVANEFTSFPFISSLYSKFYLCTTIYPFIISFTLIYLIFYVSIPLCFKNGETLGKLIFKICLLNKNECQINRLQILLRSTPMLLYSILIFSIMGLSLPSFCLILIGLFISYIMMLFMKQNRAIHDFIASSIVIDKTHSKWFKNKKEKEEFDNKLVSIDEKIIELDNTDVVENIHETIEDK